MVSFGVQSVDAAHCYVNHLLEVNVAVPFAKHPSSCGGSGAVVGYAGVDWFELDGRQELEFGYRLVSGARGVGNATEASLALLDVAHAPFDGQQFGSTITTTFLATIHRRTHLSIRGHGYQLFVWRFGGEALD